VSDTIAVPENLARKWINFWGARPSSPANEALWDVFTEALWKPPITKVQWVDTKDHPYPVGRAILVDRSPTDLVDGGIEIDTYYIGGCVEVQRWAILEGVE